jgi:hypothetical protein
MTNAPFVVNDEMTSVAIAYHNRNMIADAVLFRVPAAQKFSYLKYKLEDGFTIPDTLVGRTGRPNKVEFSADKVIAECEDHALEQDVPQSDIDQGPLNGVDPLNRATEQVTNLIELRHEVEVANLVFDLNTYPAANRETLSGTDQLSDFENSDPIDVFQRAIDAPVMRPVQMVLGRSVWSVIKRHPKLVKAVYPISQGGDGMIVRQALADLLEIEDIQVGEALINTARKGQTANIQEAWGKHISFNYKDSLAGPGQGTTFGFTAQNGNRRAGTIDDGHMGLDGGVVVKAGERVKSVISAADLCYFIQHAVA